jgi:hypothetical protein
MNQLDLPFSPRTISEEETYRPALAPLKGLILAWALSLALVGSVAAMRLLGAPVPWPTWLMLGFFTLAAALMTTGRWVDGRTIIEAGPRGLRYHTPLHEVKIPWQELRELRLLPAGRTWRVVVLAERGRVPFRVMRSPAAQESGPPFIALPRGETLLRGILGMAPWVVHTSQNGGWVLRAGKAD